MVIFAAKIRNIVSLTRVLLIPFSWLYGLIMQIRNFLYDSGIWKSYSFQPAIISVGNLSAGGTGKSPMIEYLAQLLSPKWKVAVLSRGYKRSSKGFRIANDQEDASTIGDEPFQFYQKLGKNILIAVDADRVNGVNRILENHPNIDVILLDDAFQHRRVWPLFSILLTEFGNPFHQDYVLPAGRLREPRSGCLRADVIVVTKCNDFSEDIERKVKSELAIYNRDLFFTRINYQAPVSLNGQKEIAKEIFLVTGIANPLPLVNYLSENFKIKKHFSFADHHSFTAEEISTIQQAGSAPILTTEKDFMRLSSQQTIGLLDKSRWFYLPIRTEFINNGSEFDKRIIQTIESHQKRTDLQ
jgi:tetraacyldisaccharide 4'-kinase